jgi:hypothetical protein
VGGRALTVSGSSGQTAGLCRVLLLLLHFLIGNSVLKQQNDVS